MCASGDCTNGFVNVSSAVEGEEGASPLLCCSLTALAVHVLARTTGLFNNNAVAYKPTIMIFMDMMQTHDGTWQPENHVATVLPLQ